MLMEQLVLGTIRREEILLIMCPSMVDLTLLARKSIVSNALSLSCVGG